MRLLPWLILLVLLIAALRKRGAIKVSARQQSQRAQDAAGHSSPFFKPTKTTGDSMSAASNPTENMICCAHCKMYVPASEAVRRKELVFCSAAHADLH